MTKINITERRTEEINVERNFYLYGEDSHDKLFYAIYLGKNFSYQTLRKYMKSLEGLFVSNRDLRKEFGSQSFPCRKDQSKIFEEKYSGKFEPFDKEE